MHDVPGPITPPPCGLSVSTACLLGALAALLAAGAGCAVEGGRLYPVIGLGYVVVPTNTVTAGGGLTASGSRFSGLVAGTAGPVTGVLLGHAEALSLQAGPDTVGLAEATLSRAGFSLRLHPHTTPDHDALLQNPEPNP